MIVHAAGWLLLFVLVLVLLWATRDRPAERRNGARRSPRVFQLGLGDVNEN